jgi:NADPH oxidase
VYTVFGEGVTLARGSAAALKLDCALILLMVCRNLISWYADDIDFYPRPICNVFQIDLSICALRDAGDRLRGTWVNNVIPFDKNIVFHRYIGWFIAFWSGMRIRRYLLLLKF